MLTPTLMCMAVFVFLFCFLSTIYWLCGGHHLRIQS